jgi:hypothetical protein
MGRLESMFFMIRETCSIDVLELWSGGVYRPDSRNDLALDMRSSDEADGDKRMIGSGRRAGFWFSTRAGLFVMLAAAGLGLRDMKGAASFLTWEKSFSTG